MTERRTNERVYEFDCECDSCGHVWRVAAVRTDPPQRLVCPVCGDEPPGDIRKPDEFT